MKNVCIDKLAIQELCSRYCQTIDAQDSAGWARCFMPDEAFVRGATRRCANMPRRTHA